MVRNRAIGVGAALVLSAALAACERADQRALQSDAKKLAQDTGTAARNAARNVEKEVRDAAAVTRDGLARAGETAGQIAGDAGITARVKAALLAEKDVRSVDIDVDTFQGKVILRGVVPDAEQVNRAAQVASAVDGVKSVENRLTVN